MKSHNTLLPTKSLGLEGYSPFPSLTNNHPSFSWITSSSNTSGVLPLLCFSRVMLDGTKFFGVLSLVTLVGKSYDEVLL